MDRHFKRHFSVGEASVQSPETPLGYSGGTRLRRWRRRLASSSPRAAAKEASSVGRQVACRAPRIRRWRKALGNHYRVSDLLTYAPHYVKFIDPWRELMEELRYRRDVRFKARRIIDKLEWINSSADQKLSAIDRLY